MADIAQNAPTTSKYKPAVGDVVEFDLSYGRFKGLVFHDGQSLSVTSNQSGTNDYSYVNSMALIESVADSLVKIGYTDKADGITGHNAAAEVSRAYFSAPTFRKEDDDDID